MAKSGLLVAGVDGGGTNIKVGLVDEKHKLHGRAKAPTPVGGADDVIATIVDLVHSLGEEPVDAGVGIPGVVHEGQVLKVPNLERWHRPVAEHEEPVP